MLLERLSNAIGVSGDESEVRRIILEAIKGHVDHISIDTIGNLTATKKGTGKSKLKVMLAAHMDEIGFMVMGYDNSGGLRFNKVGDVDDRILPGLRVKIGDKKLPGVIMWTPIHHNRDQNTKEIKDLRIDIGLSSKSAVEGKVKRGERIAFDSVYAEIDDMMLRGKAFDDRVGCALLIDLLQRDPYPVDIIAAFTVQEEIGLRGAQVAAQRFKPDLAFVLEGTTAHDIPNPEADPDDLTVENPACSMGAGPVLTVMDPGMITPPQLMKFIRTIATQTSIPYQLKTALGGRTDAAQIHVSNTGVPSAVISVPCRYIHSPSAYLNKNDYANSLKLLQALLSHVTEDVIAVF